MAFFRLIFKIRPKSADKILLFEVEIDTLSYETPIFRLKSSIWLYVQGCINRGKNTAQTATNQPYYKSKYNPIIPYKAKSAKGCIEFCFLNYFSKK